MATFIKTKLSESGSRNGSIAVPGFTTKVHETQTSATVLDEIWLWITNTNATPAVVEVATFAGNILAMATVPEKSTVLLLPGHILSGTGSAVTEIEVNPSGPVVYAFGYVNRIS